MNLFWVGNIYGFWQSRRVVLFSLLAVFTLSLGALALRAPVREDISAMLPDGTAELRDTFRALGNAPFLRMVLVELRVQDAANLDALHASVEAVAQAMQPPLFDDVVTGVSDTDAVRLFEWLFERWPQLFTEDDAAAIAAHLEEDAIRRQLEENLRALAHPEGIAMKDLIQKDPLALREVLLKKLQGLSVLPRARLEHEHFVSEDGLHALIVAETSVAITDTAGCAALVAELEMLLKTHLLPGVSARVVAGHRYTAANTAIIKRDLLRVFTASTAGLVLAFLLFLRRRSALVILLLPFFAVLFALAFASVVFDSISGITIGFGAVLMGLTIDFGLHAYFALQDKTAPPQKAIESVTPPLAMCAATSIAVFSMLFFSCLPGQRQLAAYAVAGLGAAFFFALLVLPHMITPGGHEMKEWPILRRRRSKLPVFWGLLLLSCVPLALKVGFDGSLRNVGYIPPEALADEMAIRDTWGEVRDRAMAISEGGDMEQALQRNDRLAAVVRAAFPDTVMVSAATILPSEMTQRENLARWRAFWGANDRMARTAGMLAAQGELLGYAPDAFEPFFSWVRLAREPFAPKSLRDARLMHWLEPLIGEQNGAAAVVTFLEDTPEMASFFEEAATIPEGVRYVSDIHFNRLINDAISRDFAFFLLLAAVSVLALLAVLFRDWRRVALGLLPAASGALMMLATLTLLGMKFNLFNMLATVLVIGLTADYGIFMLYRIEGRLHGGAERAVLASGFTTAAGFGALALARHPALFSIGFTVLLGILPAIFAALVIMPLCAPVMAVGPGREGAP
ncbi:MAG TPA: hypothetical protein ENN65_04925 [Candidatus Hydrogenedentes bacterium]|nr:hypothetical protein [Candidatus Hydrogenedentota bacterium]